MGGGRKEGTKGGCVCVCVWGWMKVRGGEVTFSWVNGMTAISFKSLRKEPEQQNNYVTPNRRQGERQRGLAPSSDSVKCWETMQLIHRYIHYRCQATLNASSAKLITTYVFPVSNTTLITGPLARLSTADRWL